MQNSAVLFACLIYLGAVVHAWRVLPGPDERKALFILGFPGLFLAVSLAAFLTVPPARRQNEQPQGAEHRTGCLSKTGLEGNPDVALHPAAGVIRPASSRATPRA